MAKGAFDLVKSAIDAVKSIRDSLPSGSKENVEVSSRIAAAERQVKLAEAQLAAALGYALCRKHFPPVPMLKDRIEPQFAETIFRCQECGCEEPPPEKFERLRRVVSEQVKGSEYDPFKA